MGEETKKEETKVEEKKEEKTEEKKEEKTEEKQEEKTEEKKEEKTEEKPPLPFVLLVDLHCVGCAKKIEKSLLRIRGVEGVVIEMMKNEVTIKGVVEPQAICDKIMKITKRKAKVLSPLPAADGESIPQILASQVSGTNTVELNVNMHCEACALQLKRKILKMKGVRTVETELSSGKVTVTGTMDPNKLVDYVYRRTKKQAKIVPQPDPEPAQETKPEEEKKEEPKPEEEKKEEPKPEEEKKEESAEEKKDENAPGEEKKGDEESKEEEGAKKEINVIYEENSMQRMMYNYQPLYHVFERMPPPQLFSDENPNACCIS